MINLNILRCPESGQKLKIASKQRITALNKKRKALTESKIEGGYETHDKRFLYPIRNGVASFLLTDRLDLK